MGEPYPAAAAAASASDAALILDGRSYRLPRELAERIRDVLDLLDRAGVA